MRIHCYSSKGGTGKSTFSINLAGYYSVIEGKKVCIVDYDSQRTISDMYSQNLCGFDVRVIEPSKKEGYDVLIFDHHPTHTNIRLDGVVVCPIRPSRIDFESYRRGRAIIGNTPHVLVVNQWSMNGGDDKDFITNIENLCNTNNIKCSTVKLRNIFKRSTNNAQTIYNVKQTWNGVSEAKKDIGRLAGVINELM